MLTNVVFKCEIMTAQSIMCYDLPLPMLVEKLFEHHHQYDTYILIAEIMVKTMAEETSLSSLSAGTLAVLVLILVGC